jgi:hypothetical protein
MKCKTLQHEGNLPQENLGRSYLYSVSFVSFVKTLVCLRVMRVFYSLWEHSDRATTVSRFQQDPNIVGKYLGTLAISRIKPQPSLRIDNKSAG